MDERPLDRLAGKHLRARFKRGGADDILRTYMRLQERTGKIIGEHWLWCALERIAEGEPEERVLNDYMYIYRGPGKMKLDALLAGRAGARLPPKTSARCRPTPGVTGVIPRSG